MDWVVGKVKDGWKGKRIEGTGDGSTCTKVTLHQTNHTPLYFLPRPSHHVTVWGILPPLSFFWCLKGLFSKRHLSGRHRSGKKGGKSTGDGGHGGNCTGVLGWSTGSLFLSHWCKRDGVQGSSDEYPPSGTMSSQIFKFFQDLKSLFSLWMVNQWVSCL
jgi:hypothetical protein